MRVIFVGLLISIISLSTSRERFGDFSEQKLAPVKDRFFAQIKKEFKRYRWSSPPINKSSWFYKGKTKGGNAFFYTILGPQKHFEDTTLILCGVHPDEITPVKFCFDVLEHFQKHSSLRRIVIAPLVTPDTFFAKKKKRTNLRGVDVNRNFPTQDWKKNAHTLWKKQKKSPRRFPGKSPASEKETLFQMQLVRLFRPDMIISVHAPLKIIDYDGPHHHHVARELKKKLQKKKHYPLKDYPYFTGSLGKWAGIERNIPTLTLELSTSHYKKTSLIWKQVVDILPELIFYKRPSFAKVK